MRGDLELVESSALESALQEKESNRSEANKHNKTLRYSLGRR